MIQFLKDQMSSVSSDLYEEILEVKRLIDFKNFTSQVAACREKDREINIILLIQIFLYKSFCVRSS